MHNRYLAVLAAAVAAWLFGAVWYTVLGKAWQRALGRNPDDCKDKKMPLVPLVWVFLCFLVMADLMAILLTYLPVSGLGQGALIGLAIGMGFQLTAISANNMFQQKKTLVTWIDGGHWVLAAAIQGAVLKALL
jgi:hypothetical protein